MSGRATAVAVVEDRLGHVFADRELIERALTHSSVGQGARKVRDNERLEFLGDRVLGLIVAEALADRNPDLREGELTPLLHALVDRAACARAARAMGVGPALRLAPGESKGGGRENETILGDACEAVMAALYLEGGLDLARRVFLDIWSEALAQVVSPAANDPKSALQRWALARTKTLPEYRIQDRSGPDHAPLFTVEVCLPGIDAALASGRSRLEAEKAAARLLLTREGVL